MHYFVITHPDGTLEDHVGIEMEDQRIAWSFPGSGVSVAEFVKNGTVESGGKIYKVEHQYAVRPLRSAQEMQSLRSDLTRRVAVWVDDETPYCVFRIPEERFCLSCGDFIVRIIFPSTNPLSAGLPRDFARNLGQTLTTDDLLLYMLGFVPCLGFGRAAAPEENPLQAQFNRPGWSASFLRPTKARPMPLQWFPPLSTKT